MGSFSSWFTPQADLEELQEVLFTVWRFPREEYREQTSLGVAPNSLLAAQLANTEQGPNGPWGPDPVGYALFEGNLLLEAAEDHLLSLAKLLYPPVTALGPELAARPALEASAQAWRLLDPSISTRVRVGRVFTTLLEQGRQLTSLMPPFLRPNPSEEMRVIQAARQLGLQEIVNRQGRIQGFEEARPSSTAVVQALLAASDWRVEPGDLIYRLYSGAIHSSVILRESLSAHEPRPRPPLSAVRGRGPGSCVRVVRAAVAGYYTAFNSQVKSYGWDNRLWLERSRAVEKQLELMADRLERDVLRRMATGLDEQQSG